MQYTLISSHKTVCKNRRERIEFVEKFLDLPKNEFGGTTYWPIFCSHGGGYVEPKENQSSISYYYEEEILRREKLPVCGSHPGTMEFIFWKTKRFTFTANEVMVEEAESSSHIDGTDQDFPNTSSDSFGNQGFGRWNDNR
jgi:hypothetical protein